MLRRRLKPSYKLSIIKPETMRTYVTNLDRIKSNPLLLEQAKNIKIQKIVMDPPEIHKPIRCYSQNNLE